MRTRSQVIAARETVRGCCTRHADNQACDCMDTALEDLDVLSEPLQEVVSSVSSIDLDFSKIVAAKELVEAGNQLVQMGCSCCQGQGSSRLGSPGYCSECQGEAYVTKKVWTRWASERRMDYWQARALIAEYNLRLITHG